MLLILQEFEQVSSERVVDSSDDSFFESIVGNPIHAYKMMKRFSVALNRIEKDMKDDDWASE